MIRTDIARLELQSSARWSEILRSLCQILFAAIPALLLFSRGGADAAASVIGICYIAVVVSRRQWGLATHPLLATLLAIWLLLNILVSPLAVDPMASFSRSVAWLRFALLFAATMTWLIRSRRDLYLIVGAWTLTIGFSILDGLVQLLRGTSLTGNPMYGGIRITGPLDRPNIGMFVARFGFPLLAATPLLLNLSRSIPIRLGVAAMVATGFAFILLTGERSAALLSLAGLVIAVLGSILVFPRYRLHGLTILLGIVITGGIIASVSDRIADRIMQFGLVVQHFSRSHYAELFSIGLQVWRTYPVFGAGMKNFQDACWAIAAPQVSDGCPSHPHNNYIEWLAETGSAGFLGYLLFLGLLLYAAWPLLRGSVTARLTGLLVAGCMVVLLFPLIATQSLFSNWPALVFWTSLSLTMAVARLALKDSA
jgi:O-antigen ligase